MENKQSDENQSNSKMNRTPLVPVETPEEQLNVAAVDSPSCVSRDKHIFDQQPDARDGGHAQQHQAIDYQVDF